MKLRPHHLLCLQTFVGEGYSDAFCANMAAQKQLALALDCFVLADGGDDICKACPHLEGRRCRAQEKVLRYDAAAARLLALRSGEEYSYAALSARAREEIFRPGRLGEICGDCEWFSLCREILLKTGDVKQHET